MKEHGVSILFPVLKAEQRTFLFAGKTQAMIAAGDIFDQRFQIQKLLGEGGMGSVFLAQQVEAERLVALKILKAHLFTRESDLARFRRECNLLSRLHHRHIVSFYHFGVSAKNELYYAAEYVEGKTLSALIQEEGQLPVNRTLSILKQLCLALKFAHDSGIIQRDLKPDNIMICPGPEPDFVKVLDFGLAKLAGAEPDFLQDLTASGQILGTVNYMSPEQCRGESSDQRSDIYAFACTAYECLSGKKLFQGATAIETMQKQCSQDPLEELEALPLEVPVPLINILQKALKKSAAERQESMQEMLEQLESLQTELARSKTILKRQGKKRGSQLTALLLTILFLIPAAGLAWLYRVQNTESSGTRSKNSAAEHHALPRETSNLLKLLRRLKPSNRAEGEKLCRSWLDKYLSDEKISRADKYLVLANALFFASALNKSEDYKNLLETVSQLDRKDQTQEVSPEEQLARSTLLRQMLHDSTVFGENAETLKNKVEKHYAYISANKSGFDDAISSATFLRNFGDYARALEVLEKESVLEQIKNIWVRSLIRYYTLKGDCLMGLERVEDALTDYRESQIQTRRSLYAQHDLTKSMLKHDILRPLYSIGLRCMYFDPPFARELSQEALVEIEKIEDKSDAYKAGIQEWRRLNELEEDKLELQLCTQLILWADALSEKDKTAAEILELKFRRAELLLLLDNAKEAVEIAKELAQYRNTEKSNLQAARLARTAYARTDPASAEKILQVFSLDLQSAAKLKTAELAALYALYASSNFYKGEKELANSQWRESLELAEKYNDIAAFEIALAEMIRCKQHEKLKEPRTLRLIDRFYPDHKSLARAGLYMLIGKSLIKEHEFEKSLPFLKTAYQIYKTLGEGETDERPSQTILAKIALLYSELRSKKEASKSI